MKKEKLKKMKAAATAALMYVVTTVPVQAAPNIEDLILFTGTKQLILACVAILTALIFVGATLFSLKAAGIWMAAPEEEKPAKKKALITTIGISVVATVIPGTVGWILAFYAG